MIRGRIKDLYELIPGKQTLFSFIKIFGIPPEKIFRHLHFIGVFDVRVDETHSFKMKNYGFQLENEIFWGGLYYRYEKISLKLWTRLCKDARVILDIGANTGLYSLLAKCINTSASIHAFEPVARVFDKLKENTEVNSYLISLTKKALSNKNGRAIIYDSLTEHEYAASLSKNVFGDDYNEEEIDTQTLDEYVNEKKLQQIDLMKIDVEGHEPAVLEGFKYYLVKFRPDMLIEIVEEETANRLETILTGLDYSYFDIDESAGCIRKSHLGKSTSNNWLICSSKTAQRLNLMG